MVVGRFGTAAVALALAGMTAAQRLTPTTDGSLPNDTRSFAVLVFSAIVFVGALCYFPVLALGPIVEFLLQ